MTTSAQRAAAVKIANNLNKWETALAKQKNISQN